MNILLVAIHGILTRQTDPSWPDRLDAWLSRQAPGVRVLKKEYAAGPFPRWNCWVKNPRLCRGLVAEILLFQKAPGAAPRVWIVAHSNGALIALGTVRLLASRGCTVAGIILIGAACEADIERNGVRDWITSGELGRAIAYCAADDRVLPAPPAKCSLRGWLYRQLARPYGSLGRSGWMARGQRIREFAPEFTKHQTPRILSRWFAGGHSGYFSREHITFTFRQILRDMSTHISSVFTMAGQIPLPPAGAVETWLFSAAAIGSMILLGRKLFARGPGAERFVSKAEFDPFRKSVEGDLGLLRDRLDARFLALAEKIDQLRNDLLKDAERRSEAMHERLSEMEAGLARVDERTRD